jgi:hypothetical protein
MIKHYKAKPSKTRPFGIQPDRSTERVLQLVQPLATGVQFKPAFIFRPLLHTSRLGINLSVHRLPCQPIFLGSGQQTGSYALVTASLAISSIA